MAPFIQPAGAPPPREPSTNPCTVVVFMFVQLNKCVVVCGSVLQRGHSGDGCLTSSILFKYEYSGGHLFVLSWTRVRRVARGSVVSE